MRILFENLAKTATLSAGGTSINYPLSNLVHPFLKRKFQQTVTGGVILYSGSPITYLGTGLSSLDSNWMPIADALSMAWDADQTIDTVFVGYSNATLFELWLYDSGGAVLSVIYFTNAEMGSVFTPVAGVRSAKLLLDPDTHTNPTTVYLGGVGIGLSYSMPDPLADWAPLDMDNSFGSESMDGQVLGQYVEPLRKLPCNFFAEDFETYDEIRALVKAAGKYTPLWIALFEGDLPTFLPMYCTIKDGIESPRKDGRLFYFSLTLQEAR